MAAAVVAGHHMAEGHPMAVVVAAEAVSVVHLARCTRRHAQSATRSAKFHSNRQRAGLCTAGTASRNEVDPDTNS